MSTSLFCSTLRSLRPLRLFCVLGSTAISVVDLVANAYGVDAR
jgi:hypothetical protein